MPRSPVQCLKPPTWLSAYCKYVYSSPLNEFPPAWNTSAPVVRLTTKRNVLPCPSSLKQRAVDRSHIRFNSLQTKTGWRVRALAETTRRWVSTAEIRFQSQMTSGDIHGGRSETKNGSSPSSSVFPPTVNQPLLHHTSRDHDTNFRIFLSSYLCFHLSFFHTFFFISSFFFICSKKNILRRSDKHQRHI
jgi:hypothetical protein